MAFRRIAVSLVLTALSSACPANLVPDAGPDAAGIDVTGTEIDQFLLIDGGIRTQPVDLRFTSITAASFLDDGGFDLFLGAGTADGTFIIPGMSPGPYFLRLDSSFIYTDRRSVDLGVRRLGRPNPEPAMKGPDGGVGLALTLGNLAPWRATDDLQLVSWNAGIGYFSTAQQVGAFAQNAPSDGGIELTDALLDFSSAFSLLENGDDLTLVQLSSRELDAGIVIQEATRAFSTSSLSMAQGTFTPLSGVFTALTGQPLSLDFRHSQFESLRPAVHPQASSAEGSLYVSVQPGGLTQSPVAGPNDLCAITGLLPTVGDLVLPVSFGNPFDQRWAPIVVGTAAYYLDYSIPLAEGGSTMARNEVARVEVFQPASVPKPVQPLISPPQNLTVEGRPATGALLQGMPLTPAVAWAAPAIGTPSFYSILVGKLVRSTGNSTRRTFVGTVLVAGDVTGVRLPPGLLAEDTHYFLRVTANLEAPGYDFHAKPWLRLGYPRANADALTSVFKTQ
jgi:hypothetical protein